MRSPHEFFSTIKVVAFDFDQTLVDEQSLVRHRWQKTLENFSHMHPDLQKTFFSIFEAKGYKYKNHLDDTFCVLGLPEDYKDSLISSFRKEQGDKEYVNEYSREVIKLLKQKGFRIGIITDGLKSYQEQRIVRAGFSELCDFIYYGDEHQKPDPAFFNMCIKEEGILPHELLYVGDHLIKDIEGALAVGSIACYIGNEQSVPLPLEVLSFTTMQHFYQWLEQK
ncbi:MAG: hypothetical protein A2V96_02580 [Candidatus Yonathbacteria bacterium RBG_16_43_6]|uniref:HAD family hydrolase n=1 Tax=Candidatus Yonathbacteria bacterium RIFCSPLOWO2_01_FULL_43_27 TaxID=1802726 RepID=A0A1G2SBS5_9BACT|nr:MAG: hypothetical protein A2V96_02580 [Candidatus Yonathbacteria bacterium RBG_16_43_6]OHA82476.1 MAG: hypothetical protein A3B07_02530 [Candidatus Yonathbacteria bacterium RIFCSPLOWO2_01_FULL_43_27]